MLRRALDEAENQEKKQQQFQSEIKTEISHLVPQHSNRSTVEKYAVISSNSRRSNDDSDDGEENDDDDDEEEYLIENWQSERKSIAESLRTNGYIMRAWNIIKGCCLIVINVENVWDSPHTSHGREISRRNHFVILFWFFILAISYTAERTTFKLLVDGTGPFREFAVVIVSLTHALLVGCGILASAISRKTFTILPLGIPLVDVSLMALLDTFHMLLVFLTGYHVAPTLTVILIQFTIPLTAMLSQFIHEDGYFKRFRGQHQQETRRSETIQIVHDVAVGQPLRGFGGLSNEHIFGSIIIFLAVLLALCPSIYTLIDGDFFRYATTNEIPTQTAFNTILFVSSCIPAAASQLYKEHIFLQYKQPIQPDYLNLLLSFFQLIFASIISPLTYTLLGFAASDDWPNLYPSSEFSMNFAEGFQCFFGKLSSERAKNGYHDPAICARSFPLIVLYSFSVIFVGIAVDKIVNGGATKVMYRGVSAGIILSVISLYIYDLSIPDFSYGAAIDSLNLVCLLLLVVGSEIYHRVGLQDASFETVYPEVQSFFGELAQNSDLSIQS